MYTNDTNLEREPVGISETKCIYKSHLLYYGSLSDYDAIPFNEVFLYFFITSKCI